MSKPLCIHFEDHGDDATTTFKSFYQGLVLLGTIYNHSSNVSNVLQPATLPCHAELAE